MKKRVLCLLAEGVEELELVAPVDVLRRAGSEVVLSLLGEDPYIKGRNGMMLRGDRPLNGLAMEDFDLLLIPGGAAVDIFRSDGRPSELAKKFFGAGKTVAAICAGPLVLQDAGLLEGRRFTAHAAVATQLPGIQAEERLVEDGLVITSRGPGTALEFGLALVARLFGEAKRQEIAQEIMA
jgi:4-methyl-5(b-hydroxyethyl)-thiazole monophosphate biosynthesis